MDSKYSLYGTHADIETEKRERQGKGGAKKAGGANRRGIQAPGLPGE